MFVLNGNPVFRPILSQQDWILISRALSAYGHNADYAELVERLNRQMEAAFEIKPPFGNQK